MFLSLCTLLSLVPPSRRNPTVGGGRGEVDNKSWTAELCNIQLVGFPYHLLLAPFPPLLICQGHWARISKADRYSLYHLCSWAGSLQNIYTVLKISKSQLFDLGGKDRQKDNSRCRARTEGPQLGSEGGAGEKSDGKEIGVHKYGGLSHDGVCFPAARQMTGFAGQDSQFS